jgi:predicted anti-sigma-YlaC factor YlaD
VSGRQVTGGEGGGTAVVRRAARLIGLGAMLLALGACSTQALLVSGVADQLAAQATMPEDDLVLAREASAFYLKLSESVLRQTPGHLPLAEAVAGGFTQYSYAFAAGDADRLEASDIKAATRLRQRAARLYWRAHVHAMAALEQHQPGFAAALLASLAGPTPATLQLTVDQVGVAYWAAASWGAFIALSKDRPEVVADLPLAQQLARLAWLCEPDHGEGALSSLMGSLEAARVGGSAQQAGVYFDRAIAAGAGRQAGPYVARAEVLALPAGDRAGFESLLHQAIAIAAAQPSLANAVMRERAQWLLTTADDRF